MSNCICATTRPKSGTKRPNTPASFIQRSTIAGGEGEEFEEPHWVGAEEIIGRNRNAAAIEHESAEPLGLPPDRGQREAEALLAELLVELGKENSGEVADGFGVDEVELHEPLDRRFPGTVRVVHDLRNLPLILEAQALFRPAGEQVQVAAHGPEEALGTIEPFELRRRQQPCADEVRGPLDAVDVLADPVQRMEIAKAALAVGLDDIAAVAHLDVPLVALGKLRAHELGGGAGNHFLAEAGHCRVEQFLLAPQPARLEEGGADRHVLLGQGDKVRGRTDRVANLQLQIPQQVKHRLRCALLLARRGFRGEEHQIEVAERRHLAATGAAKSDDRQALDGLVENSLRNEVVGEAHELIVKEGGGASRGAAVARLDGQPPRDLVAAMFESAAEDGRRFADDLFAGLQCRQPVGNPAAVDDRAPVVDIEEAHQPCSEASLFRRYKCSSASRGVRLSGSISANAAASGSGPESGSGEAANSGRSSRPAAIPPVASRPASSFARTERARATTAGGRPASLATAIP